MDFSFGHLFPIIDLDIGAFSMPVSTETKNDGKKEEPKKQSSLGKSTTRYESEMARITWS
jgi:hypothetical protein